MSLGLNPQRSSPAAVIDRSPSAPSVPSDSTAKPEQRIAFGEGAAGRVGTAILKKSFGPALKKMEEHGAMLLIRNGGKYLPTTITKLVISQVETKLGDMTAVQLSNPKLVMALIGSIQLEGLGMTVGALATKSGVSLVSSVATAVTVEQFKRQAEQAENNKPLTDKIWKVLGDVADALNPLSMGGAGENSTMDSQRTYNEAYQRNLKQLQEAQRQLDAQKPVGQDNTRATAPATPPQVRQPTPAEIANVQKQLDASRPSLPRPIAIPGYTDTRPSEPVSAPLVGVGIVGGRAEQYTAQQLADRMQKFAGTTGGVQPASIFNWVKVSESGKFDTTLITQPVANKETAQAIAFNKKSLTVQLAVPVDYWDQTSKQHTQGYLQFKGLDPRAVLTKFNDYLVSLHGTQSFNVRGNFEDILKNSGLSVDGLKQRAQYFDNTDLAKNLPVIGGKQATLGTADMAKDLATVKHNNALNLSQGQPNKLSVLIPTNPGSYDGKPRHLFAEGIGANNAAALLQYAAEHGLLRPGTSPAQVIQANGLSSVLGIDASGQVSVLPKAETPKAETPKTLTEKEIKEAWEKLGGSELGEQIVRHADREGLSSKDVLEHIQRNPGKNLNEILAGLRDGNLSFGGTPPNGGGGRNTTVAGGADGSEPKNPSPILIVKDGVVLPAGQDTGGKTIIQLSDTHGVENLGPEAMRYLQEKMPEIFGGKGVTIINTGDTIDKGPNSAANVENINNLGKQPGVREVIHLMGNHEQWLVEFINNPSKLEYAYDWITKRGGKIALKSYEAYAKLYPDESTFSLKGLDLDNMPVKEVTNSTGKKVVVPENSSGFYTELYQRIINNFPKKHIEFFRSLKLSHTEGDFFFSHALPAKNTPLNAQRPGDLTWGRHDKAHQGPWLGSDGQIDPNAVSVSGHTMLKRPVVNDHTIQTDLGSFKTGDFMATIISENADIKFAIFRKDHEPKIITPSEGLKDGTLNGNFDPSEVIKNR
jgi:serine/threonine protein phosphatase 1